MKFFKLKLLTIVLFILFFGFSFIGKCIASESCTGTGTTTCLEIPLLGKTEVDNPAEYLTMIYQLSVGLGVALAAVMIVVGGIQWIASQDNPGKVKEAQGRITGAVIGLVILLGSYLILHFINPDLTDLGKWQNVQETTGGGDAG